ncbi:MAG: Crp/Fnr family transcriptional regulator [Flavobacteriaceae bacterium]|nr:Crp/Fnr family transcriptional regulator [Flavobacteriaceae bacterium]
MTDIISLSKEDKEYIKTIVTFRKVDRKDFLLKQNEIEEYYYFVISGCLRTYIIDSKGVEKVIQFSPQGWWIADNESLIFHTRTKFNIEAVFDSEVFMLSRSNMINSVKRCPELRSYYAESVERSLVFLRNRLNEILNMTAKQRYLNFCEKFSNLVEAVPQKYIASYIGVTPEFFSTMKKKLRENGVKK